MLDAYFNAAGLQINPRTLDDEGNIIDCTLEQSIEDWATGKWIVEKSDTSQGRLSTVFIGQLLSMPVYFESMLFSDEGDSVVGRYDTYAEAKAGHERIKAELEHR